MKKNEVVALIPARSGSKGIQDKNLAKIGGIPLLCWSIAAAKRSKLIDRVVVSTDSSEYATIAEHYGAEVPYLRPKSISQDTSTDFEFIHHSIKEFEKEEKLPNFIVHLRPTTPFRIPQIIDSAIELFIEKVNEYTSLRSVHLMSESAYKTFEMDYDKTLMSCFNRDKNLDASNNARQGYPRTYSPNGYVDVLSTSFINTNHKLHGNRVFGFETPVVTEVDSHYELDLLNYEYVMQQESLLQELFEDKNE